MNANLRATTAQRHACKHWQHMACLLDAVEKTCTDDGGVGGGMEELTAFLTPRDTESVWTCCCPRPYRPCARAEADAACVAAMVRRFRPVAAEARAMRSRFVCSLWISRQRAARPPARVTVRHTDVRYGKHPTQCTVQ